MADCPMTCEVKDQLAEILEKLGQFEEAFPKDRNNRPDMSGHRRAHEADIAAAKAKERFYEELRLDLAKKGSWALVMVIAGLVLMGALAKLGLGQSIPR